MEENGFGTDQNRQLTCSGATDNNEKDYNHATDKKYSKYREYAQQAYSKRAELAHRSQEAYKAGDKKRAGELSAEAKQQLAIAEQNNAKAAEYVFIENNRDSDDNDIDLHGLYVKEAEYILKQRIISGIRKNQSTLDCIVGKGLHSKNGIAKLKPAVEQLCQAANLKTWIDKKNSGVLHIDIRNAHIPQAWYNVNPDGFGAMDENYYAYHPNEQPLKPPGSAYQQPQPQPQGYQYQPQPNYQQNFPPQQQQHQQQQQDNGCSGIFCKVFLALVTAFVRN